MKLPLRVQYNPYGQHHVTDAEHKIVCSIRNTSGDKKFAEALVRKFNRDWRYVLFGSQPYTYTREEWMFERNTNVKA